MAGPIEVAVPAEAAGERLDRFLGGLEEIGSRAEAERLLRDGKVLVGGRVRPKSYRLEARELVSLEPPQRRSPAIAGEDLGLVVAWEDEHLIVVDKPAGLVVHPAGGHSRGTLVHGLLGRGIAGGDEPARPGIVHRLDRETSGLLVVARDAATHRRLQRLIRDRKLIREYVALVRGRPRSWQGRIEAPIGRDRSDPTRMSIDTEKPRESVTHFTVTELLRRHALLRVRLETGRTHQIRVHLAAIDLPVSGDPTYGVAGDLDLRRQFLHAAHLAFPHPESGEPVEVDSDLPADLAHALELARS